MLHHILPFSTFVFNPLTDCVSPSFLNSETARQFSLKFVRTLVHRKRHWNHNFLFPEISNNTIDAQIRVVGDTVTSRFQQIYGHRYQNWQFFPQNTNFYNAKWNAATVQIFCLAFGLMMLTKQTWAKKVCEIRHPWLLCLYMTRCLWNTNCCPVKRDKFSLHGICA